MVTPVGLTAPTAVAALRAGIARLHETHLRDSHFAPVVAGLVPDEYLPTLDGHLTEAMKEMTARHCRMVLLASGALSEAVAGCDGPLPVLLALPEPQHWGTPLARRFWNTWQSSPT
jgi:hypothetical protein